MALAFVGLALLAGLASTLSPCILPLLPIVLGAAVSQHRLGPCALAAGLAVSFAAVGTLIATVGFSMGLDTGMLRMAAAIALIGLGLIVMSPHRAAWVALPDGTLGDWVDRRMAGFTATGLGGQFMLGALLGAAWLPCVGPTLGAASVLAAQGRDLLEVSATMLAFAVGATLPLIGFGLVSRTALWRWRNRSRAAGGAVRVLFGSAIAVTGVLILTGLDKALEAQLVRLSPQWLTELTTRF